MDQTSQRHGEAPPPSGLVTNPLTTNRCSLQAMTHPSRFLSGTLPAGIAGLESGSTHTPRIGENKALLLQQLQLLSAIGGGGGATAAPAASAGVPRPQSSSCVSTSNKDRTQSKAAELFPYVLYGLLEDASKTVETTAIIGWSPNGKAFTVYQPQTFALAVLPAYFPSITATTSSSTIGGGFAAFSVCLMDDWGFSLQDGLTFFHPCFQKNQISLLKYMQSSSATAAATRVQTSKEPPIQSMVTTPALQLQSLLLAGTSPQQQSSLASALLSQILLGHHTSQHTAQLARGTKVIAQYTSQQARGTKVIAKGNNNNKLMPASMTGLESQLLADNATNGVNAASLRTVKPSAGAETTNPSTSMTPGKPAPPKTKYQRIPFGTSSGSLAREKKRAVFLTKRTKATGSVYGRPIKKQKRMPNKAVTSSKGSSGTSDTTSASSAEPAASIPDTAFVLSEDVKQGGDLPCLLFPWKLHDMLDEETEATGHDSIVSWRSDGASFAVHDQDRFVTTTMPKYLSEIKAWEDFTSTLSDWGFVRFTSGAQEGSFIHRLFVKGKRSVCKQMRIQGKTVSELIKRSDQFLSRLYSLLRYAEKDERNKSIVSWSSNGKKFVIHDPRAFMSSIFVLYFESMSYGSFELKLRRWGFTRTPANTPLEKGARLENVVYCHPRFVKNRDPIVIWVPSITSAPRTLRPEHSFLVRLRTMLYDVARNGHQFAVSWLSHGKSFMIYDRAFFAEKIMPHYFKGKFSGFRQALRNYGFAQMGATNGWDEGAHYHKLFLRDSPLLCQGVTPEQMKKAMPEWIPSKDEPNFYSEDDCPPEVKVESPSTDSSVV